MCGTEARDESWLGRDSATRPAANAGAKLKSGLSFVLDQGETCVPAAVLAVRDPAARCILLGLFLNLGALLVLLGSCLSNRVGAVGLSPPSR